MKAAIYMGKENIEVRDLPMPECGDNDVIIKNIYSSICGTDVADFRLNIAKELGFAVCNMNTGDFQEETMAYFGTAPSLKGATADIDCFIDAAGAESILELFMEQGKIESRFVSVAVNNSIASKAFNVTIKF